MILSKEQLFSDGQGPINTATTTRSTNVIDLGPTGTVRGGPVALKRDVGPGEPVAVIVTATVAGAAQQLTVNLIQADDPAMTSNKEILGTSRATALSTTKPTQFGINFLPDGISRRYLALEYVTTTTGSFSVDAGITYGKQSNVTVAAA